MKTAQTLSRRGFLRATSAAAAGLALAACVPAQPGAQPAAGGEAAAPSTEKVPIRFHARIGAQEDALYEMQMPKFMEEHPDIEIVKESFPGGEYVDKISTMLAGGTLGDAVWSALGSATIQFAWAQGIVAPVDDLVSANNIDLKQWYEGCLNGITVEGHLLGLPFKAHPGLAIIYYHQTAVQEAGLEEPKAGWTQAQQIELAKALHKAEGDQTQVFGYLPDVGWKAFVSLFRAFGEQLINEDGAKFQLNSELGMQAIQYIYDYFHTHKVAPKPDQIVSNGGDMWSGGMLGMFQAGTWASVLHTAIDGKFEWMAAPNPVGPGGVGGSDYEVDAYCVTTTTEHPNEAFEWVQYLCSKDSGIQLGIIGGTVGGRPDVYGSEELLKFPFRVVFKEVMDHAMASRITANWRQREAENAFLQLMQPLWAGNEQPTQAFIDGVTQQIQDIMDKPKP